MDLEQKLDKKEFFVVGIGASAGGLEALQQFLEFVPIRDDIAYIIAQHLSPTHKSLLTNLLSKYSKLDTIEAENGMEIKGGTLYVTPPNKDIKLIENIIRLSTPSGESYSAKPSVDMFFTSIAQNSGIKPIGILLSGTGSDGTRGLLEIKANDGITIVQEPNTAKYDGMPNSAIIARAADIIVPPERMGEEILAIINNMKNGSFGKIEHKKEINLLDELLFLIDEKIGVDFTGYKQTTIKRRIERRMSALKVTSLSKYLDIAKSNDDEVKALFQDIMIGVTSFFRDNEAFDEFKDELEEIIRAKEDSSTTIRIWDVGCSTGEETYSIAIIISDLLRKLNKAYNIQIFATDIDTRAIEKARKGEYSLSMIEELPKNLIEKSFDIKNDKVIVKKHIRDMIVFSIHNVISDPPFIKLDAIVCRNLLIYFGAELQKSVMQLFHYALNMPSILFLGKSEGVGEYQGIFSQISRNNKIFRKEPASINLSKVPYLYKSNYIDEPKKKGNQQSQKSMQEMMVETIGSYFMPNSIIINEGDEIIYLREQIKYLKLSSGHVSLNIFKVIHPDLSLDLRALLFKAKKEGVQQVGTFHRIELEDNKFSVVKLSVLPMMNRVSDHTKLYIINFQDELSEIFSKVSNIDTRQLDELSELKEELSRTKMHLQAVIEELETSNEELQSTNEELQSSNEELQSTNEELETTNEELQSTNEELQTTYAELKAIANETAIQKSLAEDSLEELSRVYKVLQKHEELNNNVMEASLNGIAVLKAIRDGGKIVDFECQIMNKKAKTIIKVDDVIGKKMSQLIDGFLDDILFQKFIETIESEKAFEFEHEFNHGKVKGWYHSTAVKFGDGVVSTFFDITEKKLVENELLISKERLNLALMSGNIGTWELDLESHKLIWDDMMFKIYGVSKIEFSNHYDCFKKALFNEDVTRVQKEVELAINNSKPLKTTFRIKWKSGEVRYIHAQAERVIINGRAVLIGINQDITEQVSIEKERELIEDTRRKSIQDLLSNIAHHWRQPLNAISLMAQDINETVKEYKKDENIINHLDNVTDKITKEIQYLSDIISLFDNTHRKGVENNMLVKLSDSLQNSINIFKPVFKAHHIVVNIDSDDSIKIKSSNNQNIIEIFTNIFLNILDIVKERNLDKAIINVTTKIISNECIIELSDDCGGINSILLPDKLFEPYITTNFRSRNKGLGLYIVKHIVIDILNGAISARNSSDGAIFIIKLPYSGEENGDNNQNIIFDN